MQLLCVLETQYDTQPRTHSRLIGLGLTVVRIGPYLVAAGVHGSIVDLIEPDRLAWAADMEEIEEELRSRSRTQGQVIAESEVQVPERRRTAGAPALSEE